MAVQVTIEDHTGNISNEAKLEENVPIARLIPALITALKYPITDGSGRPITYHLSYNNRRLNENETLASAGVQTGTLLTFLPEITAGSQLYLSGDEPLSPLVVLGSSFRQQPIRGFPSKHRPAWSAGSVYVELLPSSMEIIWKHAKAHQQCEVGGLLLGKVYEEESQFLVYAEQALEAHYTRGGSASLTFTDNTWLDIQKQRQRYPDLLTLGWYHSHPRMGIFFSSIDQFAHQHFFGDQPWYIALVVDPSSDRWGIFIRHNGTVEQCER